MKKSMCSAVALLAGAVVMGAFVQSASAATITYTQSVTAFSASNPSPISLQSVGNGCPGHL